MSSNWVEAAGVLDDAHGERGNESRYGLFVVRRTRLPTVLPGAGLWEHWECELKGCAGEDQMTRVPCRQVFPQAASREEELRDEFRVETDVDFNEFFVFDISRHGLLLSLGYGFQCYEDVGDLRILCGLLDVQDWSAGICCGDLLYVSDDYVVNAFGVVSQ